jgi:hypothetical protein
MTEEVNGKRGNYNQMALQQEEEQEQEQVESLLTPFCETNLGFVHDELSYILHPRMQIGETVYIENAP